MNERVSQLTTSRLALFDLDGTLVRTFIDFPGMRRAMHDLSAAHGTTEATEGEDDVLAIVQKMTTALGGVRGEEARREAFAELERREIEGCACPEPIAGATPILRTLRGREVRVGIITRNCRRIALDLLDRLDLDYDVLVAREDVAEFKPHPAPLLHACRELGVAPEDGIMVGDLWADIAAGKAAGMCATVGIQWAHDPPGRFLRCPPDYEIPTLADLAKLLDVPL